MSPRYDPPARPGRRILYGMVACVLVAVFTLAAVWIWSGRTVHGTGTGPADEASAAGSAEASPPNSDASADGSGIVDPRTHVPPVIGETTTAANTPANTAG